MCREHEAGRLRAAASNTGNFLAHNHLARLDLLSVREQLRPSHGYGANFHHLVE
jgi:hypothetical protein